MKTTLTCPKCSGRKLFHIPESYQPPEDQGWEHEPWALALTAIVSGPGQYGRHAILAAGPCEAVVCATCGFTEWYATPHALQRLEEIARMSPKVRVIQPPASPPYR